MPDAHRLRLDSLGVGVKRGRRSAIAAPAALLSAALLAGCAGGDAAGLDVEPEEFIEVDDAEPVSRMLVTEDGYWRSEALSEPVASSELSLPSAAVEGEISTARLDVMSLDSDGEYARLVLAWLPPAQGSALGSMALSSHAHRYEAVPFVRLIDRETGEALEPLRGRSSNVDYTQQPDVQPAGAAGSKSVFDDTDAEEPLSRGRCVCSLLASAGGQSVEPDRTELIFIDFPAPASAQVDLFAGEWHSPVAEVPVSTEEPFSRPDQSTWFFTHLLGVEDPPETYGADARYSVRSALGARSENLSGISTTVEGDTQEVSIPSEVLFDFGSEELGAEAEEVIGDAAEKINAEAQGQTVVVEGHTDDVGGEEVNQELSERRAEAVAAVMEDLLDESITIETEGFGMRRPLVPNTDADGEPIPGNQERNRRVSLRYTVFEQTGVDITLDGAGVADLPAAEELSAAEGALGSYRLSAPSEDTSETDIRFDLRSAERSGEVVTMSFAFSAAEARVYQGSVFTGNPRREGPQHFGKNSQGDGDSPGLQNISLVDVGNQAHFFPLRAGADGCLCTEVAGTVGDLPTQPSPMFAQFQLPEDLEGPLILRVPDAGQIELPADFVDQLTG